MYTNLVGSGQIIAVERVKAGLLELFNYQILHFKNKCPKENGNSLAEYGNSSGVNSRSNTKFATPFSAVVGNISIMFGFWKVANLDI